MAFRKAKQQLLPLPYTTVLSTTASQQDQANFNPNESTGMCFPAETVHDECGRRKPAAFW
jgi:hypothetical protein